MSISLVSTKLYVPRPRADFVSRPRLTKMLLAGLNRPGCFALLSGPAGYGKTTLLGEFVTRLQKPVGWVSLDEGDNDPIRFWTYLIAACQSVQAEVGQSGLALFQTPQPLPDDTIPTILINDLARLDRGLVLVLDDYQIINNPSIHGGLSFLLDHLPDELHLILSTRVDPPWPLARFRARNQLIELRAADLGFTAGEAAAFLNETMGLNLSPDDAAAVETRTEGWIAGLQLAALSIKGRSDIAGFVQAFTGSHVYVADYVIEEVLQRQPEAVQTFLLQTSILERMSVGLCEAVTGRRDAQAILTALHRANLFVIPLDDQGQWFRYHHLFADLLQARLPQSLLAGEIAALHTRAAAWYEHNGFATEAVKHALAAKDFERVASLVEQAAQTMMSTGQFNVLRSWLEALPDESFHAHPRLTIYRVLIDLSQAKLDMSEPSLREKEELIRALPPSPENDRLRGEALVLLCPFLAHQNPSRAIQMAQETLAQLPEGELRLRATLFSALYRAYGMDGDAEKSEPAYQECLRLAQAAGRYDMVANTTMVRAFDLGQYGRLREAAQYCRLIIETGARLGHETFYPAGPCYIGLAGVHLEWNDLETAEAYLSQGMELCRQAGMDGLYTGYTQRARLRQAQGDFERALEELRRLEQTFQRREFTLLARQVCVRLAMGDVAGAARSVAPWMAMLSDDPGATRPPLIAAEATRAVLMRVLMAQGEIERAVQVADELQATAEPGQRFGRVIEAQLIRALAYQKQTAGHISSEAIGHLERALDLAEPAGYVLLFLEEGPALIPLLKAVVNRQSAPIRARQHAQTLLDAFLGPAHPVLPRSPGEAPGLVEPLTAREVEVLTLIAAGASNQAIAEKLVITLRTVKKHTGNIFGKLSVSSRTQALARAHELGLL